MKLGISSYSLMWSIGFKGVNPAFPQAEARPSRPLSALELLEVARGLGLNLVQSGSNLDLTQLPLPYLDRFLITAARHGIEIELGTRGLDRETIETQARLAVRCGARLIRAFPELAGRGLASGAEIVDALPPLLPLLERYDLRLGIENGRVPAAELARALEKSGSSRVGVVLDTADSLAVAEGWRDVAERLAPHVICLRYKDFNIRPAWHNMGFICEGAPAGQGMLDADWLFKTLEQSAHPFHVILEQWPVEQQTVDATAALERAWLREGIRFLRRYVKE